MFQPARASCLHGMSGPDLDLVLKLQRRTRLHLLLTLGGVIVAFFVMAAITGVVRASGVAPGFVEFAPLLVVLLIPVIGFWSTFRFLRCPGCEHLVVREVSWHYSALSRWGPKTCPGCGKTLFSTREGVRPVFIIAAIVALLGIGAASYVNVKGRPPRPVPTAPR